MIIMNATRSVTTTPTSALPVEEVAAMNRLRADRIVGKSITLADGRVATYEGGRCAAVVFTGERARK